MTLKVCLFEDLKEAQELVLSASDVRDMFYYFPILHNVEIWYEYLEYNSVLISIFDWLPLNPNVLT